MDLHIPNLLEVFELPQIKDLAVHADALVEQLQEQLPRNFRRINKGQMYSSKNNNNHPNTVSVCFTSNGSCSRHVLFRFAKGVRNVLGQAPVNANLVSAEEHFQGESLVPAQSHVCGLDDLINRESHLLTSKMESITFQGCTLMPTARGNIGIHATIALHSTASAETQEQRLARMGHHNSTRTPIGMCRNLVKLLRPEPLAAQFSKNPDDFPEIADRATLWQMLWGIRSDLLDDINTVSKREAVCMLCKVAKLPLSKPDVNTEQYFENMFAVHGMTHEKLKQVDVDGTAELFENGWHILFKYRGRCTRLLPKYLLPQFNDVMDSIFRSQERPWRLDVLTGNDFTAFDGDEEVFVVRLQHLNKEKMMDNLGFETVYNDDMPIYSWKSEIHLTPGQLQIRELAKRMCFPGLLKSHVHTDLKKGSLGSHILKDTPIPLALMPEAVREKCQMELGPCDCGGQDCGICCPAVSEFVQATGCLQMPDPSISPAEAMGALIFLTPYVTRDLRAMMEKVRDTDGSVRPGTILISKHLRPMVMAVLNPEKDEVDEHRVLRKEKAGPHVAFENVKKRQTIHFCRHQSHVSAGKGNIKGKRLGQHGSSGMCTASERHTVTTGDIPWGEPMVWRPSSCDAKSKPTLRGSWTGAGFQSHRRRRWIAKTA